MFYLLASANLCELIFEEDINFVGVWAMGLWLTMTIKEGPASKGAAGTSLSHWGWPLTEDKGGSSQVLII